MRIEKNLKKILTYTGIIAATGIPIALKAEGGIAKNLQTEGKQVSDKNAKSPFVAISNINKNEPKEKKEKSGSGGPPDKEPEGDMKVLNISASFVTATTEFIDANARSQAKSAVYDFLKNVDDLKNSKIVVKGTYSVRRPWDKNDEIAKKRMLLGQDLVGEVLSDLGYSTGEIEIVTEWGPMDVSMSEEEFERLSPSDKEKAIDATQTVTVQLVQKDQSIKEKVNLTDFNVVIGDMSESMKDDMYEVERKIEELKGKHTLDLITLEGGNTEAHVNTLIKYIDGPMKKSGSMTKILILTDEPDNSLSNKGYQERIRELMRLAAKNKVVVKVQIFNPDKKKGGYIIRTLNTNPNLLSPYSPFDGRLMSAQEWYDLLTTDGLTSK